MAKNNDLGCLGLILIAICVAGGVGISALQSLVSNVIAIAVGFFVLCVVVPVVIKIITSFDAPPPSSTVTYSKTLLGGKKKTIEYHDTGKEVQQITDSDWLGRKKKKTYVTKPGQQRQQVRYQTCNSCGSRVASKDGSYHCSCGRRWGRR